MDELEQCLLNPLLCSDCFYDQGLKLEAVKVGNPQSGKCLNCNSENGSKLDEVLLWELSENFFVDGSIHKTDYGSSPVIRFNNEFETDVDISDWLQKDVNLIEKAIEVGFFYYGPRLWMVGEIEPLLSLQKKDERNGIINKIIDEYPDREINQNDFFYRIRLEPKNPSEKGEYDSPPDAFLGSGRLDLPDFPVLYCSQDIQVCLHECRATVEDEIYIATLSPTKNLKLLDLTEVLEEDCTEFESLDMAVHMLFFAKSHSYEISRDISYEIHKAGYDGIIYPSFFSSIRTGAKQFNTVYGLSIRLFGNYKDEAKAEIIENLALFGRPIKDGNIKVKCVNKLAIKKAEYEMQFGPIIE